MSAKAPSSNRRSLPRWETDFDVIYNDGRNDLPGVGFEINGSGMAFCTEKLLPTGTEIEMRYRLTRDAEWVAVRGVVTNRGGRKMGVRFLNHSLADRMLLEESIRRHEVSSKRTQK
jgi:PilZ domain-containing protein